jgi:hypothetical protein
MAQDADPMTRKLQADVVVETAAEQMRRLLKEAVTLLDPFPAFPGSFFTLGIEVEGGPAEGPERGCVVLGPDGELHELEISIDFSQGQADPVAARDETLKPLELHPRDYILYAYNALTRVTELLMEQEAEKAGG